MKELFRLAANWVELCIIDYMPDARLGMDALALKYGARAVRDSARYLGAVESTRNTLIELGIFHRDSETSNPSDQEFIWCQFQYTQSIEKLNISLLGIERRAGNFALLRRTFHGDDDRLQSVNAVRLSQDELSRMLSNGLKIAVQSASIFKQNRDEIMGRDIASASVEETRELLRDLVGRESLAIKPPAWTEAVKRLVQNSSVSPR